MRNEIRIVPYFLRHYETFADRIFVWDDGSDDGTRQVLENHPRVKLLPISLGKVDDEYFVRYLWSQYKDISRGKADWVMCVDVDELIYHPHIVNKLTELSADGVQKILCEGFTMYSPVFPTTNGQIYDEIKVGIPDKWSTKTVVFDPSIDIKWDVGRHRCSRGGKTSYDSGILLLHFRYLGWEYYRDRTTRNLCYGSTEFTLTRIAPMPDGRKRAPYKWFKKNRGNMVEVVH